MKKITLLFIFCLAIGSWSYSQCTNPVYQFPTATVTIASGAPGLQTIAANNWPQSEFSVLDGLVIGDAYTITATPDLTDPDTEPNPMTYITVTSDGTAIITDGFDSVSFVATTAQITIYWTLDAACASGPNRDTLTEIECTSCICTFTVAPSCVAEIAPVNNDTSVTLGSGGAVTFEWNTDPNAESYELLINGFSQGTRVSGVTFTGFDSATAYTWSVIPTNCFGAATGCPEWSFTTEACLETAAPGVQATVPFPADAAAAVAIDAPDGGLNFNWTGSGNPDDSYTLNIGIANPPTQALEGVEPGETITGLAVSTTYFWSIDVVNCFGSTPGTTVWSFTTDSVLGVTDNTLETFSVYPNPTSNVLNIKSSQDVDSVIVFNLLGQNVASFTNNEITNSSIDLSELSKGLYLVKITSGDKTQTLRVTKK